MNKFIKVGSTLVNVEHIIKISAKYQSTSVWEVMLQLSDGSTTTVLLFPEDKERLMSLFEVVEEFKSE